jgi:hypothetical protein
VAKSEKVFAYSRSMVDIVLCRASLRVPLPGSIDVRRGTMQFQTDSDVDSVRGCMSYLLVSYVANMALDRCFSEHI